MISLITALLHNPHDPDLRIAYAIAALSRAALTYGRRTAGLPDLQFINHKQEQ